MRQRGSCDCRRADSKFTRNFNIRQIVLKSKHALITALTADAEGVHHFTYIRSELNSETIRYTALFYRHPLVLQSSAAVMSGANGRTNVRVVRGIRWYESKVPGNGMNSLSPLWKLRMYCGWREVVFKAFTSFKRTGKMWEDLRALEV